MMKAVMTPNTRSGALGSGPASIYTIVAGVVVAVLQVVNQLAITSSSWREIITVVLAAAGAYGITPLFGPALTNLLQIPSQVLFFIATALSLANGIVAVLHMSTLLHAVIAGVLTLVAAILFGSPVTPVPAPVPVPPVPPAPVPPVPPAAKPRSHHRHTGGTAEHL